MNKNTMFTGLMACLLSGMTTGCAGNDDETTPSESTARMRQLTITETSGDGLTRELHTPGQPITRATLTNNGDDLQAKWTADDALTYCNLSTLPTDRSKGTPTYGALKAVSTAARSQFTGSVTCSNGDHLAVVYPAKDFSWSSSNAQYTITLSGQDGTLETLAQRFNYVYGVATVDNVTDATASATMPTMKSLLTVCKFSFTNKADDTAIPVKTLTISYNADGDDGKAATYPQNAIVTCSTTQTSVHATAVASSSSLTVSSSEELKEVYVALLPVTNRSFSFTVTNSSGTYTGKATATLVEGEYVEAMGLGLIKK